MRETSIIGPCPDHWNNRLCAIGTQGHSTTFLTITVGTMIGTVDHINVFTNGNPVLDFKLRVKTSTVALVPVFHNNTILVKIAQTGIEFRVLVSARHGEVIVLDHCVRIRRFSPPIGVGCPGGHGWVSGGWTINRMVFHSSLVVIYKPLQLGKLIGVQQVIRTFSGILNTCIHIEVYLHTG